MRRRRRLATLKDVKEAQEKDKTVEVPKSGRAVERMESMITSCICREASVVPGMASNLGGEGKRVFGYI